MANLNPAGLSTFSHDVAVVGGGPAGLMAAIALRSAGLHAVLIAPAPEDDHRTTALLTGSVAALTALGIWGACREHAAPLTAIRIVDDTRRLLRAPEVNFNAAEIGLDAFGYNIENRHLVAALAARARELEIVHVATPALAVSCDATGVTVAYDGGAARAPLVIGADGQHSICRSAAGIAASRHAYPQTALTLNFAHTRPHHGTTTEFHTGQGPFTLVPLPDRRSSLVWVADARRAAALFALDDEPLGAEIARQSQGLLGQVRIEPGRGLFPLAVATARSFARQRIALVGESAHVVPPIGAQGLNLGLRDAAVIAELAADAYREGRDTGADELLARYDRSRRADITSRTVAIDLLNRSLLSDLVPVQGVRGLGLLLADRIGPLRRALMREGVSPMASQPRLMRGEVL
jgi:2-octaprenyl-6-methoxyphenol hydroxylase